MALIYQLQYVYRNWHVRRVRTTDLLHAPKLFNFKLCLMRYSDLKNSTPSEARMPRLVIIQSQVLDFIAHSSKFSLVLDWECNMESLSVVYQRDREKTDLVFNYNKLQWLCVLILAETRTSFSTALWKVYLYMYVHSYGYMDMFIKKGRFLRVLWQLVPLLQNYPIVKASRRCKIIIYLFVKLNDQSWILWKRGFLSAQGNSFRSRQTMFGIG